MSHRVYLYNIGTPGQADDSDRLMMEAGYQVPGLLLPLLANDGRVGPNLYNTHHGDHAGLYFDAPAGIAQLRRFYTAIGEQPGLVQDQAAFDTARKHLFAYLDTLTLPHFHLDLWDVFNMTDTPHADQARHVLAEIEAQNQLIAAALAAADLSRLDRADASSLLSGMPSFAALLNDASPRYGWGYLDTKPAITDAPQPFEEKSRWGLRAADGKVLAPAQYDAVYEPGPMNRAVVMRDDRFGYLDLQGALVIPLAWDDAYDFDYSGLAIVARAGKFGLIDAAGKLVQPTEYEELDAIGDHGDYSACMQGLWGVLDGSGATVIACEHGAAFEPFYRDMFELARQKGVPKSALYHRRTGLLASGFTELIGQPDCPNLLVVRQGKRFGAIGVEQGAMLLAIEYEALTALPATVDHFSGNFMLAAKGACKGVFDADPVTPAWLFPLDDWQDIACLHQRHFAVQRAGRWYFADSADQFEKTAPSEDSGFDLIVPKTPIGGFAYAFRDEEVWVADEDGVAPAEVDEVLADLDFRYGVKLSRESRRRLVAFASANGG
jgi:hypothetical protein